MSYDFGISVDTGGSEPLYAQPWLEDFDPGTESYSGHFNYTYNVSTMYVEAMGESPAVFDGQRCGDIVPKLRAGVDAMRAEPEKFRAMNPANGWGNYEGALAYLRHMLAVCEAHPAATFSIS